MFCESQISKIILYKSYNIVIQKKFCEYTSWGTQYNDTQHNDIQYCDFQYNDTQQNDTEHNDTQHNNK